MQSTGKTLTLTCTFALAISAGCGLQNIEKPPPSEFERWEKDGATKQEKIKSLESCGYNEPTWTIEQQISVDKCMLRKGYSFIDPVRGMSQCDYKPYQILPSCQSLDK